MRLFETTADLDRVRQLAETARSGAPARLPVYVAGRPDLAVAAEMAGRLYDRIRAPDPADLGFTLVDDDPILAASANLWRPLARDWIALRAREPMRSILRQSGDGAIQRIVVLAPFRALRSDTIAQLLLDAYRGPLGMGAAVGFITGRDGASLLWHAAKQWCGLGPDIRAIAVFTDGEKTADDDRIIGYDRFDDVDIKDHIESIAWRRLLVRGHARDDNLNLGAYTMCGRNRDLREDGARVLRPRCGYGGSCFKDEAKLIPVGRVAAAEIVLSGCNAGPQADFALYGEKYQLHLAGVDGLARTIVSVPNYVHASGERENEAFLALQDDDDTAAALNASLRRQSTVPSYWSFGMPGRTARKQLPDELPPPRLIALAETLDVLQALGEFDKHRLGRQIARLRRAVDGALSRNQRTREQSRQRLWSMSMDLDRKVIDAVVADPDDAFINLANIVFKRSVVVDGDPIREPCRCGRTGVVGTPVERFERDLFARTRPPLLATVCLRCTEESFRFPQGVALTVPGEHEVQLGGSFAVEVRLGPRLDGETFVTLSFPRYLADQVDLVPKFHRVANGRDAVTFRIGLTDAATAQAYHFTAFAVKDLSVSTYRKNFKIFPACAPDDLPGAT